MTRRSVWSFRRVLPYVTAGLVAIAASTAAAAPRPSSFQPLATFEVAGEVAEILAVTPNGETLLYTDSASGELGVVDLSNPERPSQRAAVDLSGEPTSVGVTRDGRYALVSVDTSSTFTDPSGELAVIELNTSKVVRTIDLGGQPDAVAVSPDGSVAAVAIENQRDEDIMVGDVEGGMPQAPAGYLAVIDLRDRPRLWTVDRVNLTNLAGMRYPGDPEPEFVDINRDRIAAVTLQENNAVALVDLDSLKVTGSFSAGEVVRADADTVDDGTIVFDDRLTAPREPDAVQWTRGGNLVTADEGDLAAEPSGGRGWTVFSPEGDIVFSSGAGAEQALAAVGSYPDGRSDDKGAEFEGAEVAKIRGTDYAFIGSERGDSVLAYDLADESAPQLLQVLETGDAPEGLLAIPQRRLFLTSNEDDGTVSIFGLHSTR